MKVFFVCVLALVGVVAASNVITLTSENFESELADKSIVLVEFYAPWCGHCKRLEPEYETAADALEGVDAFLAKVDATEHGELASKYGVRGYPTLILFRDGAESGNYEGGRDAKAIEEYMVRQTLPAVTDLTAETVAEFAGSADLVIVGSFPEGSEQAVVFEAVANALRDNFLFGRVATQAAEGIKIYKNIDGDVVDYDGELEKDAIAAYLVANSLPLFDEVGPENYRSYVETGLPMIMVFVDTENEEQVDSMKTVFKPVAATFSGQAVFVYVSTRYIQQAQKLGLSGDVIPSFAVEDLGSGLHYAFDEQAEITEEAAVSFVAGVLAGEIAATIKSEPIPEDNSGPVFVLVADEINDIVYADDKDVFVEFYAPWCGHCKSLAPTWEKLGEAFADVDSVVIAKMDATANDIPPFEGGTAAQVSGFPTLYFYPAGATSPVKYEGAREFDDLFAYVVDNAAIAVDIDASNIHEDL